MARKRKRIPKYIQEEREREQEQLVRTKGKMHRCTSCGDMTDVGSTRGSFLCPNCGWPNKIK